MTTLFTRKNMYSLVSFTVILSLMLALVGSLGIGEALAQEINPKIGVIYNTDAVAIWDWSDGYQLTLTIDDPDNGVGVDYTDTQSSAEGVFYTNGAFDIQPGQLVTVTDGAITRQTTVTDVEISSVDPMTNIVIGTADPLDSITVATWWNCGYQTLAVTADINGDWMVDFSGTCDIIPGTTVGAYEYDNDGDSTRFDWRVPNPSLSVRILDNEIHGYEWSEGAEVTLTIDGIYSDTQTVMPADWDPNQTFVRFSFGENWTLASGQSIVLTDGSITKTHTVTELIVTGTDPEADTVSGTAAPGSQVDIGHLSCDEFGCYGYRRETADVNGDWLADFSVVGEDDDEQDIIDLYPGMRNEARQCDEDGDCTQYDWYILRPDITAAPSNDWVSGEEWPIDALITIEIDDPDTIEAPDFTTTEIATTDGWRDNQRGGNFQYWSEYDFSPGDTVTLSDGITTKSLIVSDNQFDADIDNDILFGVTDPEREIWVFVSNENIDGKQTQSDANGNWSVSFAGEYDIDVGSSFGIKVFDDDGDMTHLDWQVVRPEVWAHPNDSSEDWIDVRDWTFGETVYLTIDNDTDPLNGVLYSDSGEVGPAGWNPSVGVKEFHLGSFDLQPGHFVTVNGPTTTKELVITNIDLTEINTELGTISGTADPYSAVQAWQHEEPHCNDEVFADQYGNWTVDFSECNFGPGVGGGVGQADADGDSTVYFWWAPEDPQVQIVINHQEIHCSYWPFGAELSLTIDDPDNGTGVDYSATAWVDEVLNGDETFAMFAPGEQYEIQPGDIVTVTDGNTIKQHTVFHLDVTSIDVDTDTFIGTATPGETVEAYTWTGQGERCSTIVSGTGDWTINVSDPLCEQPFDIQLGSEGALIIHGQDNTDTQYFWKIANPQLGIRPSEDRIEGWEWELGAMVDIAIDDPGTPESPDYSDTAEVVEADWDPNQTRLDLWVDYDIKPGDIVTATDGSVTKVHTVTALTMDNADVDTDIVTGSADPDSRVDVWICDNQGCANRHVYADGGGQWSADFANPGDEDDEQDTRDITLGTWIDSSQNDEDGDGTYAGIYLNNPTFRINPNLWEVEVWEWPLGVPVTLNIDDPSNGPGVDYTDTQFAFVADWDPNSTYIQFNFRDLFDVLPGFIVTLSDGSITKEHVVSNQVVTSIDPLTDQVSGTADPGTELLAHICNEYGCTEVYVTADEYGNWIADYSGLYDLVPGTNGTVIYYDEDGDAAGIYWEIPNPTFGVRANHDNIEGWQWDEGATVTITIDDPSTPENPDYDDTTTVGIADWDPNQTWFTLELGGVYDIKVGDFVTVSDGAITKEHTVLNLTFTEFDTDADVVHGIGVPDSQINVWTCDDYGCINREEFTDGAGNWSVDFSIPGDLDWEQETADLVPGSWVDSSQSDEDGDQTMYGTNILSFTLHAVPSHPEVHGHDWEPGSDVTLIIDNDNDPDNGILYEDTRNVDDDPWCGNPCFDLSGIFDLQVGHYVTMTAGAMSKTVLVSQLTVTEVNYENDTVSGIADPGSRVAVNIWSQDGNARYVTADTAGLWVANFSQVGDEDFEQELADIQEWDWGRAIQLNPDDSDDGTLEYWGEGPSIWEAPDDVPLVAALSYSPDLNRLGFDYEAWSVANLLWEPLFRTTDQGDLMPAAASDYTVSPDGLVYTITLRDDALWSDGTPLEAQHFVDGFLRLISPDTATDYGHLLYEIDGAEAYALGETTDPNTVGLLALNNQTLQITLHRPAAYFIKVLANPGMVPARADLLDLYEDSWIAPENFVGNGPYTLLEYDDRHLLVEKNQNFHDADQLAFHQIGFAVISDENQRLDAYREGLVDVMISASTDIAKEPELASDRYPRALGIYFVGLNTEKPPLDNSLVRKALASAIDRDYMMGDIFETPWMQSATGVIPPDVPGHQGDTVGYLFDEAQAQTYLSDAGYPGGAGFPEIVLYVNDGSSDSMEYVAEQWRTVLGIPVRIQYTDWGTYSAYLRSCHQDPASCNYHAYRLGWLVDYHDAYSILGDVFHPDANFSLWDSTLYRDLIDLSLGELDPAQRLTYLEQAEQVLVEDEAAAIPLAFAYQTSLAKQTFEPAFGLVPYLDLWSYAPPTMGVYAADESMPSSEVVEIYNWAGEEVSIIIDDPATPEVGDYFETRTSVPLPEFFSGMYPGVEKIARFELAGRVDIEPGFTISVEGSPEAAYTVSDLSITNVDLGLDTVSGTSAPNEQVDLNACNNYDPSECVSFSVVADGGYWLADFGAWGFDLQVGSEGSARLYDEDGNRTMVDFSVLTSAGTGFTPTSEVVIQPGETINLAAAVNLTGPATYIGEDAIHALQMAIDDHGPIAGFDIQFAEFDSACDFASGEQAALQVVADPSIVGVIGHVCSSSVKGGAPIYEEAGLVTLSGSATMHTVPAYGPTVFSRTIFSDFDHDSAYWLDELGGYQSVQAWNYDFEARFGTAPSNFAVLYYDAARLLLERIEETALLQGGGELVINRAALAAAVRDTAVPEAYSGCWSLGYNGSRQECGGGLVNISYNEKLIWAPFWGIGDELTLHIYDQDDNLIYNPEPQVVAQAWFASEGVDFPHAIFYYGDEFEMQPGYRVVVSNGEITKETVATELTLGTLDAISDQISGTASPGSHIFVEAWQFGVRRHALADSAGNWYVDFGVPGDEAFEGDVRDIEAITALDIAQFTG